MIAKTKYDTLLDMNTNEVLSWDAVEHHHIEKTSDWYWSLGIIAVSAAILCVLFSNILFGIFILIAAFTAGLHAARSPNMIHIELHRKGILVEQKFYHYKDIESFWIDEHEQLLPSIILKSKKLLMPYIIIPIGDTHPDHIHSELKRHLEEIPHHESAFHKVLEYFGL